MLASRLLVAWVTWEAKERENVQQSCCVGDGAVYFFLGSILCDKGCTRMMDAWHAWMTDQDWDTWGFANAQSWNKV
jgi:hypothetical protein